MTSNVHYFSLIFQFQQLLIDIYRVLVAEMHGHSPAHVVPKKCLEEILDLFATVQVHQETISVFL